MGKKDGIEVWSLPRPFCEVLYDHLIQDRTFIETKDPKAASDSFERLYEECSPRLRVESSVYTDVVDGHNNLVTRSGGDIVAKKEFIKMVMYGAVFQEGWRDLYASSPG